MFSKNLEQLINVSVVSGITGSIVLHSLLSLPLAFIAIENSLNNVSRDILTSASLLTNSKLKLISQIVLPLIKPGITTGIILGFVLSLTDFSIPTMLGVQTLASSIYSQYLYVGDVYNVIILSSMLLATSISLFTLINKHKSLNLHTEINTDLNLNLIPDWIGSMLSVSLGLLLISPFIAAVFKVIDNSSLLRSLEIRQFIQPSLHSLLLLLIAGIISLVLIYLRILFFENRLVQKVFKLLNLTYPIPEIVLAMGIVLLNLRFFHSLYQSIIILSFALVIKYFPIINNLIEQSIQQIGSEPISAAKLLSKDQDKISEQVILPLIRPQIFNSLKLGLIYMFKDVALVLILATAGFSSLAAEIWHSYNSAFLFDATITSLFMLFVIIVLILLGNHFAQPNSRITIHN